MLACTVLKLSAPCSCIVSPKDTFARLRETSPPLLRFSADKQMSGVSWILSPTQSSYYRAIALLSTPDTVLSVFIWSDPDCEGYSTHKQDLGAQLPFWTSRSFSSSQVPNFWCSCSKERACFEPEPIIKAYSYALMGDGNFHVKRTAT